MADKGKEAVAAANQITMEAPVVDEDGETHKPEPLPGSAERFALMFGGRR